MQVLCNKYNIHFAVYRKTPNKGQSYMQKEKPVILYRIPSETHKAMKMIAVEQGVSVSDVYRIAIDAFLKRREQ